MTVYELFVYALLSAMVWQALAAVCLAVYPKSAIQEF